MPQSEFAAVAAPDGRIYAIGGAGSPGAVATVEAYDPQANTWSALAPMPTPRSDFAAAVGKNGRIYVIGGITSLSAGCLSSVEAYDPQANTWSEAAPMPTPRCSLAAAAGSDGRIYAIGGVNISNGALTSPLSTVEAYDPTTNAWSSIASMPTARESLGAATGSDGRIYAIGGLACCYLHSVGTVEAYNTRAGSWSSAAPMKTPRTALATTADQDGRIYAIGGLTCCATTNTLSSVESYDPRRNSWSALAPMPTGRSYLAAATGSDGRIYAIGGTDSTDAQIGTVEAYAPQPQTPNPPSSPLLQPKVPETTKVLGGSALGHLIPSQRNHVLDVSARTLTLKFEKPGAKVRVLHRGDVIVTGITKETPSGMVRRVMAVRFMKKHAARLRNYLRLHQSLPPPNFSEEDINTTSATLAQALGNNNYRVYPSNNQQLPCFSKSDWPIPDADGLTLSGSICPSLDTHFMFVRDPNLYDEAMVTIKETGHLTLTASQDVSLAKFEKYIPIGKFQFLIGVPPTAVPVVVELSFVVRFDGTASASASIGLTESGSGTVCAAYDNGQWSYGSGGWSDSTQSGCRIFNGSEYANGSPFQFSVSPDTPPTSHAGANFTLSFGPHITVAGGTDIVGVGPDIGVEAYTHLGVDATQQTWTLDGGVQVPITMRLQFLGNDVPLWTKTLPDPLHPLFTKSGSFALPTPTPTARPTPTPTPMPTSPPRARGFSAPEDAIRAFLTSGNQFPGYTLDYGGPCTRFTGNGTGIPGAGQVCSKRNDTASSPPVYVYELTPAVISATGVDPTLFVYLGEYSEGSWAFLGMAPCQRTTEGFGGLSGDALTSCLKQHTPAFTP